MSKDLFKPLDQKVLALYCIDRSQQPGVLGVLVVDEHGLAIASKFYLDSNFHQSDSGYINSIVKTANLLADDEVPVVAVELERSFILIYKHDEVILAVNKSK